MPFKSKAQWRKCYREKDPNWDCDEFAAESPPYDSLPERKRGKPRRMRRNESKIDWAAEGREVDISRMRYVMTVINPVTHRLFDIVDGSYHVNLICPDEKVGTPGAKGISMGNGHFDTSDITDNYARSHSPGGVVEHGVGYGLLLYSGMAVCASVTYDHTGIFSQSNRSSEADEFWASQTERGYASDECLQTGYDERNVTIPISESEVEEQLREEIGDESCDLEVENVEDEAVITVGFYESKEVQTLDASTVMHSGFVLTWSDDIQGFADLENNWKAPPLELMYELKLDNCFDSPLILMLLEQIEETAGADVDNKRLLKMLETAPPEIFADPSDEMFEQMKKSGKLHQKYLELAGQTAFDFDKAKERQKQLVANQRHSQLWVKHFGSLIDSP